MADGSSHAFPWPQPKQSALRPGEIVVDLFAGGGGASTALESALGRPVDIAINHCPTALAMHAANHPLTVTAQVRMVGNSVSPPPLRAIAAANLDTQITALKEAA